MTFAVPQTLFLLLIILPIVWVIGFPRYAFRRRRDVGSLILRSVILTLLILALAGLQVVQTVDRLAVVFLVDASDSIGTELREAQLNYIREAVADKPIDDEWSVVVFGGSVSIDTPFSSLNEVPPVRSTVLGSNTNIASAIQTAISLFPADARRRIVILSDGQETIGSAEAKARLAQASGVEISYVLFARDEQPDVRITELTSPASINEGQEFDITVSIESTLETSATLLLFSGNQLIREQAVTLNAGRNSYTITERSADSGFLNFSAQIIVPNNADDFTQNNQLGTFSQVIGPARVLLISNQAQDIEHLLPALANAGFQVDVIAPSALPADTATLALYKSILISDVPAAAFNERQMTRIQSYVRDLGGGVVFIGGAESYGVGGYFQSTLEDVMPVETQIRDQQRLPRLTIAYLVDRSGSMGVSVDGVFTNLQLAQRAITLSINFLQPTDRAAVGTFDSSGAWVAPFQDVENTQELATLVETLRPGGGTDIMAGMRLVERDIITEPSERKHLILITDGGSNSIGLVALARRLNTEYGVTLSVLALGSSAPPFLREMTEAGQGNYHVIPDISQIPNVLAQETVLATRSYIQEGVFSALRSANNPIMDGITGLPNLTGYVATTARDTAQVILRGPEPYQDPLLVSWQYGLGRSIAFTSDATSRWGTNWVGWSQFSRFWGQVVDYSITENADSNIESRIVMEDERARVIVDARDDEGLFLNNLGLQVSVIAPDNSNRMVRLQQTAPGRYEGSFLPTVEGAYFLAVNGNGVMGGVATQFNDVTGWVMSYSPEYALREANPVLLETLASITNGQNLADNPSGSFAITQQPRTASVPIAPYLLILAIVLLPLDIAIRRMIITRTDLARLRAFLFPMSTEPALPEERISSLFSARERARERTTTDTEQTSNTLSALKQARDNRTDANPSAPMPTPNKSVTSASDASRPQVGTGSTVGNLLKRKRGDEE